MSRNKQRLELTWIGKDKRSRLEPRILLEDAEKSCHADERVGENDIYDNKLIFGDNLLALKALEADYSGQVKCIYIDPPYNTGNAFEHYDDGLEHSIWLGLMRDRLDILRKFLSEDGSIWINLDDSEVHYLKVLLDEIFGRKNFVAHFIWEKKRKPSFLANVGNLTDHILLYSKEKSRLPTFSLHNTKEGETYPLYNAGNKRSSLTFPPKKLHFLKHKDGMHKPKEYTKKTSSVVLLTELIIKDGFNINTVKIEGAWRYNQSAIDEQFKKGEHYIVKSLDFRPRRIISDSRAKKIHNLISRAHYDMATNEDAAKESIDLYGKNTFDYPKPEKLIQFIIQVSTNPGDLVLDSFAGSGTTGAVAHKMGRRWIMAELGNHCDTHIVPRLKKVIDGTDQGGISKAVGWKGGGGFRYYRLAPSMLEKDKWGNWVISKKYNGSMLAEAMCKHMGFTYAPNDKHYWMQGYSTESDFIYITTRALAHNHLRAIAEDVGPNRTLLICCKAFNSEADFDNLTVKKIPSSVLQKCEWGKDDYSLDVANLPQADKGPQQLTFIDTEGTVKK